MAELATRNGQNLATLTVPRCCGDAGCKNQMWQDPTMLAIWFQHGENREARRMWTLRELYELGHNAATEAIRAWLFAAHERVRGET